MIVGLCKLDAWMPWLPHAAALLDDAERQRAGRMKRRSDGEARVLSYALHRLFLGAAMGLDPDAVSLSRDAYGCPVLAHGDWHTSLSHAEAAVAFAVSMGGPVGIDVEHEARAAGIADIADDIWHPSEHAAWSGTPGQARTAALLETWVRKEAYLKASGTGLREPMSRFALPDGASMRLAAHPTHGQRDEVVVTVLLPVPAGHVAALSHVPAQRVRLALLEPD